MLLFPRDWPSYTFKHIFCIYIICATQDLSFQSESSSGSSFWSGSMRLLTDTPNRNKSFQQIPPNHNTVLNGSQTGLNFRCVFDSHTFIWHIWVFYSETSERSDFPKIHFAGPQHPLHSHYSGTVEAISAVLQAFIFKSQNLKNSLESHLTDTKTNLW